MNRIIMRNLWNWFGSGRTFPTVFHLRCIVLLMVCVIRIIFPINWRWARISSEAPQFYSHQYRVLLVFVCIRNFPFEPNKMFGDSFNLFIPFKSKASILLANMCCKYWCHGKMVFILCLYLNWHLTLFPWFDLSNAFLYLVSLFCKHYVVTYQFGCLTNTQRTQRNRKRE